MGTLPLPTGRQAQGGAIRHKFSQPKTQTKNSIDRMKAFLFLTDMSFIPVHKTGLSDAFLVNPVRESLLLSNGQVRTGIKPRIRPV